MAPLNDDEATSTSTSATTATSASERKQPSIAFSAERIAQGLPVVVKELIAGGAAGAVAKTCVAPLERVKILFQTGRMAEVPRSPKGGGGDSRGGSARRGSISGTLASIARCEGPRGLFKGNGASVLRIVPYSALHFGAYEQYRAWLVSSLGLDKAAHGDDEGEKENEEGEKENKKGEESKSRRRSRPPRVPATVDLVAGSAAGATAVLATYPLDLARTRLAYDMEGGVKEREVPGSTVQRPRRHQQTVRSVLRATVATHGLRGLYCGIGPTLAGILPYAGLKFYVYQSAKHAHLSNSSSLSSETSPSSSPSPPTRPSVAVTLAFGAAAGLVAQTATYPLDVVRRQMQVAGLAQAQATRAAAEVSATSAPGAASSSAATATTAASARPPPPTTATATSSMPRSTLAGLRSVWASGGLRAAFAGVSINYLKVVPSTAIGFTTYDALKSYLGLSHNL